jgi:hypothetical protein
MSPLAVGRTKLGAFAVTLGTAVALTLTGRQDVPAAKAVPPAAAVRANAISEAFGIHLTQRGQSYFGNDLGDFLYRVGYSYDSGGFDSWNYAASEPLRLDRLPVRFSNYRGTLAEVSRLIDRWLMNFSLNSPLFEAGLSQIQYGLQFNRLGVRVDPEATRALPRGQGIALRLNAEIGAVRVEVASARGRDRNNSFLGDFGADGIWLATRPESVPLQVEVPFSVELRRGEAPRILVSELRTNLEQLGLDFGWAGSLVLPRVEIEINGRRMALNQARLERELHSRKQALLQSLQAYLQDYVELHGPGTLNEFITDRLPMPLADTNRMNPPGAPSPLPDEEKFHWGLTPETLEDSDGAVHLGFSAWVEDPMARAGAVVPRPRTRELPLLDALSTENYDVAVSLNQDLINRMLTLSYNRGYFPDIPLASGKKLRITSAPEFRLDQQATSGVTGKLHAKFSYPVDGIQAWIVRNPIDFELDLDVRLVTTPQGIRVELVRGDEQSIRIDPRDIQWELFAGKVYRAARAEMRRMNAELIRSPKVIVDQIPFPNRLGGLPIRIRTISADRGGHIVVYIEYGFRPLRSILLNSRLDLNRYRLPGPGTRTEDARGPSRRR